MNFWIRAEATETIGAGHALRCIGLAEQLLRDGHRVKMTWEKWPDKVKAKCPKDLSAALPPGGIEVVDSYTLTPVTKGGLNIGEKPWWFLRDELRDIPRGRTSLKSCLMSFGGFGAMGLHEDDTVCGNGVELIAPAFDDYAAALAKADIAIGACGVSAWERAYLGIPSLVTIAAENQVPNFVALKDAAAVIPIITGEPAMKLQIAHWVMVFQKHPDLLAFLSEKAMAFVPRDSYEDFWKLVKTVAMN